MSLKGTKDSKLGRVRCQGKSGEGGRLACWVKICYKLRSAHAVLVPLWVLLA